MVLEVSCSCGKELRFPEECAGKLGICPECGGEVRIPGRKKKGSTLIIPLGSGDEEKAVELGGFARALDEAGPQETKPASGAKEPEPAAHPKPAPSPEEPRPAPGPKEPRPTPEKETSAYLPDAYEVVGELVKFHCACGQKVSAPVNTRRTSGRCPRCRRKLLLPRVTGGKEEEVHPLEKRAAAEPPEPPEEQGRCPRCGRIITGEAGETCPSCGASLSEKPAARAGRARLVAGLIDLAVSAAAFGLTAWAAGSALGGVWAALLGVAAGVVVWFVNGAAFAVASSGRTFGMLAAGLRIAGKLSWRTFLKRAALALAFPMWARDLDGQSFADRKAGTALAPRAR